jgi:hypothetical protein
MVLKNLPCRPRKWRLDSVGAKGGNDPKRVRISDGCIISRIQSRRQHETPRNINCNINSGEDQTMRVSFLLETAMTVAPVICFTTSRHGFIFFARAGCEMHEESEDDEDGADLTLLTVEFCDPLDAA